MASNKCVVVLTPNGRRQTVKVTPNTTILQILEEVCKKQGFKSEEYDLKHHKNVLDVYSIIRFSGLPNNATLEMCAVQRTRIESSVTVGVQLEDGTRLTGNFKPDDNLWHVLNQICPDKIKPEENLVIIYTRQEVYGKNALQTTTLRSLGLTTGRAMLRLIHRSLEELKTQANISAPLPVKPVEEKPYVRKFQKLDDCDDVKASSSKEDVQEKRDEEDEKSIEYLQSQKQEKADILTDFIRKERNKKNNPTSNTSDRNSSENSNTEHGESMEVDSVSINSVKYTKSLNEQFVFLGERNAMAFSLEMANTVPKEDLPDEFFELTVQDAHKLFYDLKKKREELENSPLETEAQRKLEESKKILRHLNKYKSAVLRIQFPDRTVLQGTFKPTETFDKVMEFVRNYIHENTPDFHLYTTPPKKLLDMSKTLVESECVPCAVVHFGVNEPVPENFQYLRPEIFTQFVSPSVASIAASKLMVKNPKRANYDEDLPLQDVAGPSTSNRI